MNRFKFLSSIVMIFILTVWIQACIPTSPVSPPFTPPNPMPKGPQSPTATFTPSFTNTVCVLCTPTFTSTPTLTRTPTNTPGPGTPSNTPTRTFTPSPTNTTAVGTPTFTPTVNATWPPIPMGLYVTAVFTSADMEVIPGFSVTINAVSAFLSINQAGYAGAAITLTTPSGNIPVTWAQDINTGTYVMSQYINGGFPAFNYVPNGLYSISITNTPLGTAYASMNAPGQITFDATGSTAQAAYPGNYDQAQVMRNSPAPVTTFISPAGVNVGSPYTYPLSAYNSPSYPATFATTYAAALTIYSFTGTGSATGAFVGNQSKSKIFTR